MGQGHGALRLAIAAQANSLPWDKDELMKLHHEFAKCAKQSGDEYTLDKPGFKKCLEEVKVDLGDRQAVLEKLFDFFDESKGGNVNFHEFVVGLNLLLHGTSDETLKLSFEAYDKDNSGFLEKSEIRSILSTMNKVAEHILGDKHKVYDAADITTFVDKIMKEADTNHDGKISPNEYKRLMRHHEVL